MKIVFKAELFDKTIIDGILLDTEFDPLVV